MKHIVFSDVKMTIEELDKQELIRLKMWIARAGDNAHGLPITEEALFNSKASLVGKPIVAKVKRGFFGVDFEGHEKDEIPIGVVLKEDDVFFEQDEDGVTWLCAYATIWARYCRDASFIIERDKIKSLSMEILTDIDDNDNIVSMYFTGVTLLGTFVDPAIENARAELMEFSKLSEKITQLYFAKDVTNFPNTGDNKKVSLKNSEFPQFDFTYANKIKDNYPKIWKRGGNIRGNEAFELWGKARENSQSNAVLDWIDEREAWAARHYKDKNINGVVAAMKWGVIISRGESYMKELIDKEVAKIEDDDLKKDFSSESPSIEVQNFKEGGNDLEDKDLKDIDKEEVDMSANGNVDPNARAEDMAEDAEANKEKSKEFLMRELFSKMLKAFEDDEDEKEEDDKESDDAEKSDEEEKDEDEDDLEKMEAKFTAIVSKYAKMKEEHTVYMEKMKEFEELKEFKCNYEKQMMQAEVEKTMNYVSDIMPKEEMESMRMEATKYSLDNINIWSNAVKAKALEFSKPIKNDGITRMGLTDEQPKKSKSSIWD